MELGEFASESFTGDLMLETRQQEALLRQMLPDHVVKALKEGRTPSYRHFDMVTVYFSDIQGFTSISSSQDSKDVCSMLDDLYTKFDALCQKYELMKVETIGDAYMLVGGLREVQHDHAERVARFALEAIQQAGTVPVPGMPGKFVKIKSGFHSGEVTSGVVGRENPRYCLFGDTVNVASRMESTGQAGRVQMSSAAARLVRENPELSSRVKRRAGEVMVKGKQAMHTFWLLTDTDTGLGPVRPWSTDMSRAAGRFDRRRSLSSGDYEGSMITNRSRNIV